MRFLDHGARVLHERTAEENERERHEDRSLVDRIHQSRQVGSYRIVRADVLDLSPVPAESLEHVHVRRELQVGHDDFPPWSVVPKRRGDDGLCHGHVLVHGDRAGRN